MRKLEYLIKINLSEDAIAILSWVYESMNAIIAIKTYEIGIIHQNTRFPWIKSIKIES
jgi:hypothetical protein